MAINVFIAKRMVTIQQITLEQTNFQELTFEGLKRLVLQKRYTNSVSEFTKKLITEMKAQDKHGNAQVYSQTLNKLEAEFGNTLGFLDIHLVFLRNFESKMIEEGMSTNGRSTYLRTLRAIYNKAIEAGLAERSQYPFDKFKIKTESTIVRALSLDQLKSLSQIKVDKNSPEWHAKNLFFLSFSLIGMNMFDLCLIKTENIRDNRIQYIRQKTGKHYSIQLNELSKSILALYSNDRKHLLPLLPADDLNASEVRRISKMRTKTTNKYLSQIGQQVGLNIKLTTYVARHSWASNAKRLGYSNELISDALGHSIGNSVTQTYLDRFEDKEIDEMNRQICSLVMEHLVI